MNLSQIQSLRIGKEKNISRENINVIDYTGNVIANLDTLPRIKILHLIKKIRSNFKHNQLELSEIHKRMKKASNIFINNIIEGNSLETSIFLIHKASGLPVKVVKNTMKEISHTLLNINSIINAGKPINSVWDLKRKEVLEGCGFFSRKGDILSVISAGNGPGTHNIWLQAIAMGYHVILKGSSKEPFSGHRLACALDESGLGAYITFIYTDHEGTEIIIDNSDLALIYGGNSIATKYANKKNILVQGPGRSKVLIGKDQDLNKCIDTVIDSFVSLGGKACVAASSIFTEGDPNLLKEILQEHIKSIPLDNFPLANLNTVESLHKTLDDTSFKFSPHSIYKNCFYLNPYIEVIEDIKHSKIKRELPFPCITIVKYNRDTDCSYISNSLVVSVLSEDSELIQSVLFNSSIANVYIGKIPTTLMNYSIPHDGFLSDFVMCNRGIKVNKFN